MTDWYVMFNKGPILSWYTNRPGTHSKPGLSVCAYVTGREYFIATLHFIASLLSLCGKIFSSYLSHWYDNPMVQQMRPQWGPLCSQQIPSTVPTGSITHKFETSSKISVVICSQSLSIGVKLRHKIEFSERNIEFLWLKLLKLHA